MEARTRIAGIACLLTLTATASTTAPAMAVPAHSAARSAPLVKAATATAPAGPVLTVEVADSQVLAKVMNPQSTLAYRLSNYTNGKASGTITFSSTGHFHVILGSTGTYTFVLQSVSRAGTVSAPTNDSVFSPGPTGSYQTRFTMSPTTVAAYAQASATFVASVTGECAQNSAYTAAAKTLSDIAAKSANAQTVDAALLAKWSQALIDSSISTKGCTKVTAIARFAALESSVVVPTSPGIRGGSRVQR